MRWRLVLRDGRLIRGFGESRFDRRIRKLTDQAINESLKEIDEALGRRFG